MGEVRLAGKNGVPFVCLRPGELKQPDEDYRKHSHRLDVLARSHEKEWQHQARANERGKEVVDRTADLGSAGNSDQPVDYGEGGDHLGALSPAAEGAHDADDRDADRNQYISRSLKVVARNVRPFGRDPSSALPRVSDTGQGTWLSWRAASAMSP